MLARVKRFLKEEKGYTTESLVWTSVLGIGAATLAFGLYVASRFQAGGIGDDLKAIVTPSSLPTATEQVSQMKAGYTGAITGLTITK
ncbi:MAG: hypothetical protein ACPLRU_02595 [Desulfofundulus sp.]